MSKSLLVIGGTGQIGRAAAHAFHEHGWRVRCVHRGSTGVPDDLRAMGVEEVVADRSEAGALARALGDGADVVLDCVAFTAAEARQLLEIEKDVGALAVVSSASVYCDARGRTLDEAGETGFPDMAGPMTEAQPTVPPSDATYSTRKVMMERALLDGARVPVTVLRPCAIHGPGSSHAREWWFVQRALDGRRRVPLAFAGRSRFHTTAAATIAEACRRSVEAGGTRILNVGDPDPPDVAEIGRLIGAAMDHPWTLVPLSDAPGTVGRTPWSVPRPFLLDTGAAARLGVCAEPYASFVRTTCAALVQAAAAQGWRQAFPDLARYPIDLFDYAAEDRALAAAASS